MVPVSRLTSKFADMRAAVRANFGFRPLSSTATFRDGCFWLCGGPIGSRLLPFVQEGRRPMVWTTPTLVEICIGLEINGYLPAEF